MLASLGVYWAVYGGPFAAGLIGSIYIHEMGHVAALRRFGIAASAPMFIPGFGAIIRSRQRLSNAHEEARVGLAARVQAADPGGADARYSPQSPRPSWSPARGCS